MKMFGRMKWSSAYESILQRRLHRSPCVDPLSKNLFIWLQRGDLQSARYALSPEAIRKRDRHANAI
jgi:hypothetical protein